MFRIIKTISAWGWNPYLVLIALSASLLTGPLDAQKLCHNGQVIWRGGGLVGCVFDKFGDAEKSMCKGLTVLSPDIQIGTCWVCIEEELVSVIRNQERWHEVTVGVNQSGASKGDFSCLSGISKPPKKEPIGPTKLAARARLKHKQTGKCIFGVPKDGDAVRNWTCWNDPNMVFVIKELAGNEVRLRHEKTQKCLYGDPENGGLVRNWGCWDDPNMVFEIDALGGGEVRLRHKKTKKCLYGDPKDGGFVRNWACWADPNMIYILEYL